MVEKILLNAEQLQCIPENCHTITLNSDFVREGSKQCKYPPDMALADMISDLNKQISTYVQHIPHRKIVIMVEVDSSGLVPDVLIRVNPVTSAA